MTAVISSRSGLRRRRVLIGLLALLFSSAALVLWLRPDLLHRAAPTDDDEDDEPVLTAVNPGYAGIQACAACHAQRVAEFQGTRHFKACVPARDVAAPGFAGGKSVHPSRDPKLHFEMQRQANELSLTVVANTPEGEQRVRYEIGLVYGAAGPGDEMYFAWQGDRLYNLPVAWLYPLGRWGHAVDSSQPREASASCLECHNTWIAHVPGTTNEFRRSGMLLGVTCERCHGPGQEHVAYHQQHPNAEAAAIVHPGQLTRERLLEVCTQCHGNNRRRGPVFSYRPGQPLDGSYHTAVMKYPEEEMVANQVRYLRESKCFQKSELTCITCHPPHRPHEPAAATRACLKCHAASACGDQPRLPADVRGDCIGCHMPSRVWMNVRFHTSDDQYVPIAARHDHRIAVHPEAKQTLLVAWLRNQAYAGSRAEAERLAAKLVQHWSDVAEQRRRAGRFAGVIGALREAMKIDANAAVRKLLDDAIAQQAEFDRLVTATNAGKSEPSERARVLLKVLALKPDYAPALGELGALNVMLGDTVQARAHLQAAALHDPEDGFCITTLAALAYNDGRLEEALAHFARADEIEPYDANTQYGWGRVLLKLERWPEATAHFRKALAIAPKHAAASAGLCEALQAQGQADEALVHGRRAVRWTEAKNAAMLLTLADAYSAARRTAEAHRTLEQALLAAEASDASLLPAIRARIQR